MKRCPECRRDYSDDTLLYCLEDGVVLVQGTVPVSMGEMEEPATAILSGSRPVGIAPGLPSATDPSESRTAFLQPTATAVRPQAFDRRLLAIPLLLVILVPGAFFGYRYFAPAKQIDSIAVMPFV